MKLNGFVGPTYNLDSVNVDCQRCVNLIPQVIENPYGKEGNKIYYTTTPGLTWQTTVGEGPIRLIVVDNPRPHPENPPNRLLVVSGNEVYKLSYISGAWVFDLLGEVETTEGEITAEAVYDEAGLGFVVFVDSLNSYVYQRTDAGSGTDSFSTFGDQGWPAVEGATKVLWLDGFFIYLCGGTNRFFVSKFDNPLNAVDFASSEADPDTLVGGIVLDRRLYLINQYTTEIWAVSGNADFPFERISGGYFEKGGLAPESIKKVGTRFAWLGRDKKGQGQVYACSGATPERISTYAVEQAIKKYANPQNAKAFTYSDGGHEYYVLTFDEATWVYDFSTGMWHEWLGYDYFEGFTRHRANAITFFSELNFNLAGHFETGDIYSIDKSVYKDDEDYIVRMRIAPHLSATGKRLFFSGLQIDMETGIGLDGNVQGSDPQMILTWSNDGGHTWSSEVSASAGKKIGGIGDFKKRVKWNRLGSAYDRVFKLKTNEPVPITIMGAFIDVEVGAS